MHPSHVSCTSACSATLDVFSTNVLKRLTYHNVKIANLSRHMLSLYQVIALPDFQNIVKYKSCTSHILQNSVQSWCTCNTHFQKKFHEHRTLLQWDNLAERTHTPACSQQHPE